MNYCSREESVLPVILTLKVTEITNTTAISGGDIVYDGGSRITSSGICWNTVTNPSIENFKTMDGEYSGKFYSNLTDLHPGTVYYVRAYAANKAGTAYGFETAFTTIAITPVLTTAAITDITTTSATSGGIITSDGGFPVTARGVCWDTVVNPTITDPHTNDGQGIGSFSSFITGLMPDTRYYVRAYASNSGGTAYGTQANLTTFPAFSPVIFNPDLTYGTVSDIDGNSYKTIKIGSQTWMAENLKTTRYNDGTPIPLVTADTIWFKLQTPGYCWMYNNEATFKDMYGAIYNYFTVTTGILCPAGWHVSTKADWDTLANFLGGVDYHGGDSDVGGMLKETGTTHWHTPNTGATNISGFTAIPGGQRSSGSFSAIGYWGRWWCSDLWAVKRLQYNNSSLEASSCDAVCGYSVRCVKDD